MLHQFHKVVARLEFFFQNVVINQKMIQREWCRRLGCLFPAAGLLALVGTAHGQEALRLSEAGDQAAEAQHQANAATGYYNFLLGPTAWRFSSGLDCSYNDNVRLEQTGAEDDFIIRPSLNTQMHWPVTLKNSLDFTMNIGYSDYVQHSDLSQVFITPGSGLSFDVYVGDFKINLHDRIGITEYSYQNAGASANQNLESLQNTVGIGALWDLGNIVSSFGYDHTNYVSLSQNQEQPDSASENINVKSGVNIRPEWQVGLEAGGTLINSDQASSPSVQATPDAVQWSAGVYSTVKISDYMNVEIHGGYTVYTPDNTGTGTNKVSTSDTSGFYLSASLTHRVNRWLNYSLTAGRSTDLAAAGQAQSYYYVRLTPSCSLFRKYSISTPVWWQEGTRIYNTTQGSSDYDQIGVGVNVNRTITQKLSAGVYYDFVQETSNQAGNQANANYTDNIVGLNLTYQF